MDSLTLSPLGHTWVLDLDGTVVRHNGYKTDGYDTFLDGAEAFLRDIPEADMIVLITSRTEEQCADTIKFLADNGVRYDHIIFNAPYGERILVNDRKPSGLDTAVAVNVTRDRALNLEVRIDRNL